jgi:hypothetical protein
MSGNVRVNTVVGICAIIAGSGACSHQQKVPGTEVATAIAGCYSLNVFGDQLGPERLFPRPPDRVRMTIEHDPKAIREGYAIQVLSGGTAGPGAYGSGVWILRSAEDLVIYWGFEMTGTSVVLHGRDGQYRGTATSYSDLPTETPTNSAVLTRISCTM